MSLNRIRTTMFSSRAIALPVRPASLPLARSIPNFRRYSTPAQPITEELIKAKLVEALNPSEIKVIDTSGGCGSFFNIDIVSKRFNGLSKVKQHKLVQDTLKKEVGQMHGLSMRTVPEE